MQKNEKIDEESEKELILYQILAEELAKCSENPIYFINRFCFLKDQIGGKLLSFTTWPSQINQLRDWIEYDYNITLKSRQIGISWLSAAYVLWCMIFKTYYRCMIISKKEDDAIKYLDKVKFMYQNLPATVKDRYPIERENRLALEMHYFQEEQRGGNYVFAESSNPDAGRSETLNLVIFDEAAFIPESGSIWSGAEPTIEKTKGKVFFISTANGYGNLFEEVWHSSESMQNGFKQNFISWQGDPGRSLEWYNNKARYYESQGRLREFRQEYPNNPEEAFLISGATFFDPDLIQRLISKPIEKFVQGDLNESGAVIFIENSSGPLKIWEMPKKETDYAIGVDVAEGTNTGDFSVAAIYNRKTGCQAGEYSRRIDTDSFSKVVERLGYFFNKAMINIEMNSCGESIMNYISKQHHYPNLYRQWKYDQVSKKKVSHYGFRTSNVSKRTALDAMAQLLREDEMIPKSRALFEEMKTFASVKSDFGNWTYKASGNGHDDIVAATWLVAIILQEHPIGKIIKRSAAYYRPAQRFQRKLRYKNNIDIEKLFS